MIIDRGEAEVNVNLHVWIKDSHCDTVVTALIIGWQVTNTHTHTHIGCRMCISISTPYVK